MTQPFNSSNVIEATLVDAPQSPTPKKSSSGCIVGVLAFFGLLILLICGGSIFFVWNSEFAADGNERELSSLDDLQIIVNEDFTATKTALENAGDVTQHPAYDRIDKFVSTMQEILDDESNRRIHRHIDYDGMYDRIAMESKDVSKHSLFRQATIAELRAVEIGPSAFSEYKILHIDDSVAGEFRVCLQYPIGYSGTEPSIWWLKDNGKSLQLYDWCALDYGMRNSTENAVLYSCTPFETIGQNNFVQNCDDYFATVQESDPVKYADLVRKTLKRCEDFNGPPLLEPNYALVTANRWFFEDETERALALIDRISNPELAPGSFRLRGDILFEQEKYTEAIECYKKYRNILGPTPQVQDDLAMCYRELGDVTSEREILNQVTDNLEDDEIQSVLSLIEINDHAQNESLFQKLDQHKDRESIYSILQERISYTTFFKPEAKQLREHILKALPGTAAATKAQLADAKSVADYKAVLSAIDLQTEDEADGMRYDVWAEIDEKHIVEVFKGSGEFAENFASIISVEDEDRDFKPETMKSLSELVLQKEPKHIAANYRLATYFELKNDFAKARQHLTQAFESSTEGDGYHSMLTSRLVHVLYKTDDDSVVEFAKENDAVSTLLANKKNNNDFSGMESLIETLDADSPEYVINAARLEFHKGNHKQAMESICDSLSDLDEDDEDYSVYSFNELLIEMAESSKTQGNAYDAFDLAPNEQLWASLSRRAIRKHNWTACKQLLESTAPEFDLHRLKLQRAVLWEQGKYAELLENAPETISRGRRDDLSLEYGQLIRAALRENKADMALRYTVDLEQANDFYLATLSAIRTGDVELSKKKLESCTPDDLNQLRTDDDLLGFDLSPYPALTNQATTLSYEYSIDRDIDCDLLFGSPFELEEQTLNALFSDDFGENVSVSKIKSADKGAAHWLVKTADWTIVATGMKFTSGITDGIKDEQLKSAIETAKYEVSIAGYSHLKAASATTRKLESKLMQRSLSIKKLLAIGRYYRWVDRKSLETSLEDDQRTISQLIGGSGIYHYPDVEFNEANSSKFIDDLVAELRKFKNSNSAPQINLQVIPGEFPVNIEVRLEQIIRQQNSYVQLIGTVTKTDDIVPFLAAGQRVEVPIYNIEGFKVIDADGKVTSQQQLKK